VEIKENGRMAKERVPKSSTILLQGIAEISACWQQ
jgi:hypothetical protein